MQTAAQDQEQQHPQPTAPAAEPQSQPLPATAAGAQTPQDEDDPETILANAVAAIDTQPLIGSKKRTYHLRFFLEDALCLSVFLIGIAGIVWQVLTYPHMLVVLYTQARPAALTTPLAIPTRTLAPVMLTRSATVTTTGWGHQQAKAASGLLTFYNGSFAPQTIAAGRVFVGTDGVPVATQVAITLPAAQPPQFASLSVAATATSPGSRTNIAAGDIDLALSSDLLVKNLTPFTGGRDARTYRAVAASDLATATSTTNEALTEVFPNAFPTQPGEAAMPTLCHATTTATHRLGEEAQRVSITIVKTCSAVAYRRDTLSRAAHTAFLKTRPAASYHLLGSLQTTVTGLSPLTVRLSGRWAYTFTPDYEQQLAEQIQGDSPAQARAALFQTGVIAYASIPGKLPPASYIDFAVLVR